MSQVVGTHGLIWFLEGNARLGPKARTVLETSEGTLILPATVIAEACWMIQRGKTSVPSVSAFLDAIDRDIRFQIVPLDRSVIEKSNDLTVITEMHDRQIVATALILMEKDETVSLITYDSVITASDLVSIVW